MMQQSQGVQHNVPVNRPSTSYAQVPFTGYNSNNQHPVNSILTSPPTPAVAPVVSIDPNNLLNYNSSSSYTPFPVDNQANQNQPTQNQSHTSSPAINLDTPEATRPEPTQNPPLSAQEEFLNDLFMDMPDPEEDSSLQIIDESNDVQVIPNYTSGAVEDKNGVVVIED